MMKHEPKQAGGLVKAHLIEEVLCILGEKTPATPPQKCPFCASSHIVRRGKDHRGRQRFKCKDCGKSFSNATSSTLQSSKMPAETWLLFIDCFIGGDTLRTTAEKCDVSLRTAWYMKRRIIQALPRTG